MTSRRRPGLSTVNPATGRHWTLYEACAEVMVEAKEAAGDICAARTLMYKVRPRIQGYISLELDDHYFLTNILPKYQREAARPNSSLTPLEGVYFEPRGVLEHPHDGGETPLGTRQVDGYTLPDYEFDKILFVEKVGLKTQLEAFRLGQKYDMAIIHSQGFSVVAARELLASLPAEMPKYGLHDGDWAGYNIGRTLGEATERMPDHFVPIIDLGLRVQQAIDLRLNPERVIRKTALPKGLELNAIELDWFGSSRPLSNDGKRVIGPAEIDDATGRPIDLKTGRPTDDPGKFWYDCRRVELNEFSAQGLADFIEAQLQAHGVTPKIVPPEGVLDRRVTWERRDMLDDLILAEIDRRVDRAAIVDELLERHPELIADLDEDRVREWFAADGENIFAPWHGAVKGLIQKDFDAVDELHDSVVELLVEQLEEPQDDE